MIVPYFSATKINWLLDEVDGLRARAGRGEIAFGTIGSIHELRSDEEILGIMDISAAFLLEHAIYLDRDPKRADVLSVYCGVRPLVCCPATGARRRSPTTTC